MAPKQAPRCGAKSRATARPIPADIDPPTERRTKRRHDPAEQPGPSSASPSSAKRGRASSSGRGRGSAYPRRKILDSSPEVSEKSTSSSSESSQPSKRTPSKPLSAGKTILKPRAMDLDDNELNAAFPEGQTFSCKCSVDTTINGVDTIAQSKGRNVKKRSTSVDTSPGQVDTRDRSQRNMLTGFHLRSTLNQIVSTLESLSRRPVVQVDTRDLSQGIALPVWDSVSTHLMGRSTHSGISVT
ncbi:hypothetical protein Taro_032144 [Colocasia esculenta]|uniref:Uncharacterized protein n=1 Tax=Colocasia esculenta TaxID=4460 RepID=A0A843VWH7_COLES|nr:hypothetical protein [Colocasia esculenta]